MRRAPLILTLLCFGCAKAPGFPLDPPDRSADAGRRDGAVSDDGRCPDPPRSPPEVTLDLLRDFCEQTRAGSLGFDLELGLRDRTQCGEPLTAEDLPHLTAPKEPPSCEHGPFAATMLRLEDSVRAGRIAYDPVAAESCRALGRQRDGGMPFTPDGALIAPCSQALVGVTPIGSACAMHEECAEGAYCRPTAIDSCGGVCAAPTPLDAPCVPRRELCVSGATCRADGAAFRCLADTQLGLGEPCSQRNDHCAAMSTCVTPAGSDRGTCRAPAEAGEPCSDAAIDAPPCADRCMSCDHGRCRVLGTEGARCTSDRECLSSFHCGDDQLCHLRPRRGEPCGLATGRCLYDDDSCVFATGFRDPEGASTGICVGSTDCPAQPPEHPAPAPKLDFGAACTTDAACESGYCNPIAHQCEAPCTEGCSGNFLSFYNMLLFYGVVVIRRRSLPKERDPR